MDWQARLELLRVGLLSHLDALVALHLLALVGLTLVCAPLLLEPFRRSSLRQKLGLVGLMVLAFVVHALVIPALTKHVYDGHEADYYDVWRGVRRGLERGYRAAELLRTLYRWVGPWFNGSGRALVLIQLALSLLTVPLAWLWVRELTGLERAGLWAAFFLAIDPVLGFWASSAYNVQLPFLLSLSALAVLERALRRGSMAGLALSLTLWVTAVATREEALLVGLPLGWRLFQHLRKVMAVRGWKLSGDLLRTLGWSWGWILAVALPAVLMAVDLVAGSRASVGGDASAYLWAMFRRQALLFDFFAPYQQWPALLALAVSAGLVWTRARGLRPLLALWIAMVLSHHLAYALFDDYDFRHTLIPRLALAALAGTGLALLEGSRVGPRASSRLVGGLVAAGMILPLAQGLQDVGARYYANAAQFLRQEPRFRTAPFVDLEPYRDCVFVAESYYYQQRYAHASHFELFDPVKLEQLERRYHGCLVFVYDLEDYQASSRSIDGRALKVARFFDLSLLGKRIDEKAESSALFFAVKRP